MLSSSKSVFVLLVWLGSFVVGIEDRCFCELTGKVEDCCCTVETVDHHNNKINPIVSAIVKKNYFRYYRVNLKKKCPFWPDDSRCGVKDCNVDVCREDDIPPGLKGEQPKFMYSANENTGVEDYDLNGQCLDPLGDINTTISDEQRHEFSDWQEHDETEDTFCDIDDESSKGLEYVDLLLNPERYTGYKGFSANRVWTSIYKENCFNDEKNKGNKYLSLRSKYLNSMCLEKRSFYRLISGMHASINVHLSFKYLLSGNAFGKAVWGPSALEFRRRFDPDTTNGEGPSWLKNLYFTYLLVLRAVVKAGPYWEEEAFYTGDQEEDDLTKRLILDLIKMTRDCPSTFDETQLFTGDVKKAKILKESFRKHFKNITRIMDCVGCDKCRLWGKLQTTGIGTALKILFSSKNWERVPTIKGKKFKLSRIEITSLFNALDRSCLFASQLVYVSNVSRGPSPIVRLSTNVFLKYPIDEEIPSNENVKGVGRPLITWRIIRRGWSLSFWKG